MSVSLARSLSRSAKPTSGVWVSSSFQHSRDATLKPGQSANVDGYTVRYVKPHGALGNLAADNRAVADA